MQFAQSRQVLASIEEALAALRARVEPVNPELFRAMSEDYVDDILRIRAEIDAYTGLSATAIERAPLWLVLEGTSLNAADVSSRLLSDWLDKIRKSIQNVTDYLQRGEIRFGGRPSRALLDATDLRVVAFATGSVRIGLRLPTFTVQGDAFESEDAGTRRSPRRAVERLLEMALWVQSATVELPRDVFPDNDEATIVANQLADLVPSRRGLVRSIRFEGALVPNTEPVRLRAEDRQKLRGLIQLLSVVSEEETFGLVREIDLDAQRIILRERGAGTPDMKCFIPDHLMDTAEEALDKMVRVKGLVSSSAPDSMDVTELVPLGAF